MDMSLKKTTYGNRKTILIGQDSYYIALPVKLSGTANATLKAWYYGFNEDVIFENEDVKNDIKIIGEGLDEIEIYGRARNFDGRSDTNINIIGDKVLKDESSTFWNTQQCIDQACYQLKKQTALNFLNAYQGVVAEEVDNHA